MNKLIAAATLGILTSSSFLFAAPKANAFEASTQVRQNQTVQQTLVASKVCVARGDEKYCRDSDGNQYYRDADGNEYYLGSDGTWIEVTS